jgi:hypothetical protein
MGNIELEAYCDEIHRCYLPSARSHWMYIGILFVPLRIRNKLLTELLNKRCIRHDSWVWDEFKCPHKCDFHDKNNTEIKYQTLDRSDARYRIARRWLKEFLIEENSKKDRGLVYFNILGLNLKNMKQESFGSDKSRDLTIYNRFFRTALINGANYFFGKNERKTIRQIYHDKGSQETHDYFPWHPAYKINLKFGKKLLIENERIEFIDSNHREYSERDFMERSQFIQFIDLILGSVYCCLHNPTEKEEKRKIGLIMKPLLQRLLSNPNNPKSSFHYHRKQKVSFFPKGKLNNRDKNLQQLTLSGDSLSSRSPRNNFYTKRQILLTPKEQGSLDEFL